MAFWPLSVSAMISTSWVSSSNYRRSCSTWGASSTRSTRSQERAGLAKWKIGSFRQVGIDDVGTDEQQETGQQQEHDSTENRWILKDEDRT
jgi:catalase (peroxidase I)